MSRPKLGTSRKLERRERKKKKEKDGERDTQKTHTKQHLPVVQLVGHIRAGPFAVFLYDSKEMDEEALPYPEFEFVHEVDGEGRIYVKTKWREPF